MKLELGETIDHVRVYRPLVRTWNFPSSELKTEEQMNKQIKIF